MIRALAEGYGAEPDVAARLAQIALDTNKSSGTNAWWDAYGGAPATWFETYLSLESEATSISMWHPTIVPGLLQSEDYAREITVGTLTLDSAEEVERHVKIRMARQQILSSDPAPRLWAVLDEAVLRRVIGGPSVMRHQLRHLVDMSHRPNVTVQVLPLSAGTHAALVGGPFVLVEFADPADPAMVYLEGHTGATYVEEELDRFEAILNLLRATALPVQDSRRLIEQIAAELYPSTE